VFRRWGDEVVIGQKPDQTKRVSSAAQLAQPERFRKAAMYGKLTLADAAARALYEAAAKTRRKPLVSVMVADFLNSPMVDEVEASGYNGQIGDPIVIRVHDDFGVTGVQV
jgi:hypothetical protein